MTHCEWLEEHGFMDEYLVNCELFCKNKNGTHDSFTLK